MSRTDEIQTYITIHKTDRRGCLGNGDATVTTKREHHSWRCKISPKKFPT